jgi:hypothetical protein
MLDKKDADLALSISFFPSFLPPSLHLLYLALIVAPSLSPEMLLDPTPRSFWLFISRKS